MTEELKWEREEGIFASFLKAEPYFAGANIVRWEHNHNASPDILCTDALGNRVGVEMTEWLDERQTRDFSSWEDILGAVRVPQGWTINVRMHPFGRRCKPGERNAIAAELGEVIAKEISRARARPSGVSSFWVSSVEFKDRAPTAARYCDQVEGYSPGSGLLLLLAEGSFSPADAEAALHSVLTKKIQKKSYAAIRKELGLSALYLLIYYDIAIIKNTPNFDVDPPAVAAAAVAGMTSAFDSAFVLMFPSGDANSGRAVYRAETS